MSTMREQSAFITITGADERTDVAELAKLDAEVGILYTAHPDGQHRYPSLAWINSAVRLLPRVSLHICGNIARSHLAAGDLDGILEHVQRIQVNGVISRGSLIRYCVTFDKHTIITQHTSQNAGIITAPPLNHAVLIDDSGGRGVERDNWTAPWTEKSVGCAGGLGPDNLATHLPTILENVEYGWWVDMEGKLRDADGWFSLDLAKKAVDVFHKTLDL